ncbi:MAG: guanine deaminase [Microlunatus sp.]|nr:guanine deaminase [Microlunatus sp.]MDN5769871.1 guanine deaminase [Microlunatus sp.]MDN5803297.1 guanine deaminase [Microlunatus sp.]
MTIFHGTFVDVPENPFDGGRLRTAQALLVGEGAIVERGALADLRSSSPDEPVVDLTAGLVLPGFVDAHVHFPQLRIIGTLGLPLLDWLEHSALPEEARLADIDYARGVARDFVTGLLRAGTTTALVFGAHYAAAVDALFAEAGPRGLRITAGLVVSDRLLRDDLLTTPERAYDQGLELAQRWHGSGRLRYAVTPRFSLSCSDSLLESCAALHQHVDGSWLTSHLNEDRAEVAAVEKLFPGCDSYLDTYAQHQLVGARSVFAHNVHPRSTELAELGRSGASVAHCPTSNSALGSGLFPLREHVANGVRVALGSDVGGGTGLSLLKEGLQAYFMQQLLGEAGIPLTSAHLLHLATASGAAALGLTGQVGEFSVGSQFDALWVRPVEGSALDCGLRNVDSAEAALAKVFALGTDADVAAVWIGGQRAANR